MASTGHKELIMTLTLPWHYICINNRHPWWLHKIETFSMLLALCEGNLPVTGGFSSQRPVTWKCDVFFDLCLNKQLSKQRRRRKFETPSCLLWSRCDVLQILTSCFLNDKHWDSTTQILINHKHFHTTNIDNSPQTLSSESLIPALIPSWGRFKNMYELLKSKSS